MAPFAMAVIAPLLASCYRTCSKVESSLVVVVSDVVGGGDVAAVVVLGSLFLQNLPDGIGHGEVRVFDHCLYHISRLVS